MASDAHFEFQGVISRYTSMDKTVYTPSTSQLLTYCRGFLGACVNLIGNSVAQTEIGLFSGETEIKSHPLLDLLEEPNSEHTQFQFLSLVQNYLDLCGRAYLRIIPGSIAPVDQLIPLPPDRVTPIIESGVLKKYKYNQVEIPLDRMIAISRPAPVNPYGSSLGCGEIAWAYVLAFEEYWNSQYALLHNGGVLDVVASPKDAVGVVNQGLAARLSAWWTKLTSGFGRAHFGVSPIALDFHQIGIKSKDMEGSEGAKQLKVLIANCFSIPPAVFDSARSQAELEAAQEQYGRYCLDPRCTLLGQVLSRKLAKLYDESLHLEFNWSLPEDEAKDPEPENENMAKQPGDKDERNPA